MSEETQDWKVELQKWLEGHEHKTPQHLAELRAAFERKFPREALLDLSLEQYAVGRPDSFCYWAEFKTHDLGSVAGGSASKWGVYWSKHNQNWLWNKRLKSASAEEAFQKIRSWACRTHRSRRC